MTTTGIAQQADKTAETAIFPKAFMPVCIVYLRNPGEIPLRDMTGKYILFVKVPAIPVILLLYFST
jgi:hypothetical protein